jgi:hypothetical protein
LSAGSPRATLAFWLQNDSARLASAQLSR